MATVLPKGMSGLLRPFAAVAAARGTLFPWVPVCIAIGSGFWFSLPYEPRGWAYVMLVVVAIVAGYFGKKGPELLQPVAIALACVCVGGLSAGMRAHLVTAPVLDFRYYGPIQGRIIGIDKSQTDALRLTLDQVDLDRVSPQKVPQKIRISLHGLMYFTPEPGQVVQTTGHLAAPEGPVEPGGFDFQRMAWFQRLGAIGYTRSPVLLWQDPAPRRQTINRWRTQLSNGIMAAIPGDAGAFSSGVMTGDRSGLSLQAVDDLRKSSLTHLLAISGMNMMFLIGFVFGLIRYGVALVPFLALRLNSKKIAAFVSLGVAWFYLQLSGANVATERAFIMVTVMLLAVLLNRRSLSMRSVAIAATILLIAKPESLLEPGFQMSFAATIALIGGFEQFKLHKHLPKWAMPPATLVLSSLVAGLATGPFGAAHFNRIADYGFFANLLTVPVMGAVVMPAGAIAALLAPFGLADGPLWLMGQGSAWILYVAHFVAQYEGSVSAVPGPNQAVLPLLSLGGLFILLWHGHWRLLGVLPIIVGFFLWGQGTRPLVLISPDAALVGIMTADGRALSGARGAGFAAKSWLENDGDLGDQISAAARQGFQGPPEAKRADILGKSLVILKGKKARTLFDETCASADIVVTTLEVDTTSNNCLVIGPDLLNRSGGLAVYAENGRLIFMPTKTAQRLWHRNKFAPLPVMELLLAEIPSAP